MCQGGSASEISSHALTIVPCVHRNGQYGNETYRTARDYTPDSDADYTAALLQSHAVVAADLVTVAAGCYSGSCLTWKYSFRRTDDAAAGTMKQLTQKLHHCSC